MIILPSAAKLAVSMAVQAILGAFSAALGSMIMLVRSSRVVLIGGGVYLRRRGPRE